MVPTPPSAAKPADSAPLPVMAPAVSTAEARRGPRLLFLVGLFGVLLNFPLLAVFDHDGRAFGVPVLYLYVLLTWLLLVALTGWLTRK